MKALCASFLTVLFALLPVVASPADTDKTLKNIKGTVTYGVDPTPKSSLAVNSNTTLNDKDYAATGANSLASLTLPDSSQIEMASNSSVQMQSFDTIANVATAKFVVVGKMRFTVNHPNGAKADYTFSTATGQIAVRGTIGDISANPGGLQVNVYALSNPSLPVQVTLANGQVFTLAAGQSLVATAAAAGAVTASVTGVSQSMFTPFSELGAPANAGSLGITGAAGAGAGAAGAAGGATAAIAGGAAAAAAITTVVVSNNASSPSPAPTTTPASPSPSPSTTSVPITVNHAPPMPPGRPGARPSPGAN
ncbi:MAG TPA: FecR family protein [Candidatus Acidoferrum sp.]|jgi:hypothetical protein|nr:FecR family protein [Candidatus Acidoferrum sp.]